MTGAAGTLRHGLDSFVLDGEAVLLGADGIADLNCLHSRKHDDEVQLYAFDIPMSAGDGHCRCTYEEPSRQDAAAARRRDHPQ
jgi:ATP-dependent DNA ligase